MLTPTFILEYVLCGLRLCFLFQGEKTSTFLPILENNVSQRVERFIQKYQCIFDDAVKSHWPGSTFGVKQSATHNLGLIELQFPALGLKNLVWSFCGGALSRRSARAFLRNSQLSTLRLVRPSSKLFFLLHTHKVSDPRVGCSELIYVSFSFEYIS